MGKRRHEASNIAPSKDEHQSKRPKPGVPPANDGPFTLLLTHADELIDCLRRLQSEESQRGGQLTASEATPAKQQLSFLSSKLLPAFQAIAPPPRNPPHPQPAATLPPLPPVLDPKLETAALTHIANAKLASTTLNYERLEWVGDAYLEVIATVLIHQTFPELREGRCAQLRELLVRNSTLATFTTAYGIDKRASLPDEFRDGGRVGGSAAKQKQRVKALGDLFEAYVGAVVMSDPAAGVARVANWLKVLWGPTLKEYIKGEETKGPVDSIQPKTRLEQAIGGRGAKIEYKDLPSTKKHKDNKLPLYTVGCFLHGWGETDKQLGFGSALGKSEAGQKAAQMALDNKKLLKPYMEKRQAAVEAALAARDAAAAAAAAEGHKTV
ncbi:ribonuclease III domain-containing protein [Schizothecium vesticola]|uniref:Ribonuclease III domain-containing protein n=1 Tax=Schizothecium vesticola TaxID=314040 RepID=A0AA40EJW0_9PEZI|nr:ribonuclease III domain-containing protein [Schizothecium vesticola]